MPKTEPTPAVAVEAEEPKQSPAKTNGTEAVLDVDIVFMASPTEKAQQ